MPDESTTANQLALLAAHRRTLAVYLRQQAALGAAHVPPGVANGIDDERGQIRRIKEVLRGWGQVVEDHPDDEPPDLPIPHVAWAGARILRWATYVLLAGGGGLALALLAAMLWQNRPGTLGAPSASAATPAPPPASPTPALAIVMTQQPGCALPFATPPLPTPTGAGQPTLRLTLACAGEVITVTAQLPHPPAAPSAFLAEPDTLAIRLDAVYVRTWLDALAAYAGGDDRRALERLDEIQAFVSDPPALLLRAQVLMHLAEWEPAREAYGALAEHAQAGPAERAQARAGLGLAYILAAQSSAFQSPSARDSCRARAYAELTSAIEIEPARVRWWLGRALARVKCVAAQDYAAIGEDVKRAQVLAAGAPPDEQALAHSMAALVALDFQENQDLSSVEEHARAALQLAPWQAMPYHLLSCVAGRRSQPDEALRRYYEYQARLVWGWEQRQAAENLARGAYCLI